MRVSPEYPIWRIDQPSKHLNPLCVYKAHIWFFPSCDTARWKTRTWKKCERWEVKVIRRMFTNFRHHFHQLWLRSKRMKFEISASYSSFRNFLWHIQISRVQWRLGVINSLITLIWAVTQIRFTLVLLLASSKYNQSNSVAHIFRPSRSREQDRSEKITRTSGESTRATSTEPLAVSFKGGGTEGSMTNWIFLLFLRTLQSFQINMVKNHTVFERKNLAVIPIERAFFILNKNFYCWK